MTMSGNGDGERDVSAFDLDFGLDGEWNLIIETALHPAKVDIRENLFEFAADAAFTWKPLGESTIPKQDFSTFRLNDG